MVVVCGGSQSADLGPAVWCQQALTARQKALDSGVPGLCLRPEGRALQSIDLCNLKLLVLLFNNASLPGIPRPDSSMCVGGVEEQVFPHMTPSISQIPAECPRIQLSSDTLCLEIA